LQGSENALVMVGSGRAANASPGGAWRRRRAVRFPNRLACGIFGTGPCKIHTDLSKNSKPIRTPATKADPGTCWTGDGGGAGAATATAAAAGRSGARSPRGERVVVMVNSHQLLHFLRREEGGGREEGAGGVPGVLAALDSGRSLESG
jgi:hypothetical protein